MMKSIACYLSVFALAGFSLSCAPRAGKPAAAVRGPGKTALIRPRPATPPAPPSRVTLDLGAARATPGDSLTIRGCIPPIRPEEPVDIYLMFRTPRGRIYSVMRSGEIRKGFSPYEKGVTTLPDGWCGVLHGHVACADAPPGKYTSALIVMPVNEKVSYKKARGHDRKTLTIVWP